MVAEGQMILASATGKAFYTSSPSPKGGLGLNGLAESSREPSPWLLSLC